jgi:hypothetical protein
MLGYMNAEAYQKNRYSDFIADQNKGFGQRRKAVIF